MGKSQRHLLENRSKSKIYPPFYIWYLYIVYGSYHPKITLREDSPSALVIKQILNPTPFYQYFKFRPDYIASFQKHSYEYCGGSAHVRSKCIHSPYMHIIESFTLFGMFLLILNNQGKFRLDRANIIDFRG